MKRLIWAVVSISVLGGAAFWATRQKAPPTPAAQSVVETALNPPGESPQPTQTIPVERRRPQQVVVEAQDHSTALVNSQQPSPGIEMKPDGDDGFKQTIELLVSPQTDFGQKQAVWQRLRGEGKLDQVIKELEQRVADHPAAPECPTALGQAYVNKIPTSQDSHEPAILGLKADQSFDAALQIDPSYWEARFFKAAALSYWPEELNKGAEVVEQFNELIKQQEAMPPQPHFAQTYVLLGKQYQKEGYTDYARQVWQRGAALFPNDSALRKLATTP